MPEYVRLITAEGRTIRNDYYNYPAEPASYIIFQKAGKTYAKNGRTGQLDYADTDAATATQQAINSIDRGTIVLKELTLSNSVNMKSNVKLLIEGKVTVDSDIDAFIFDSVQNAGLIGGEIEVTATYTKAPIKLTGNECYKNRVSNLHITLPSGQGYGIHIVAGTDQEVYGNEFEDIRIYQGKRGVQVELSGDGWCNVNKFENIWMWKPSEYGFAVENAGNAYSGNWHAFIWVEIGNQDNVSAFYFLHNGTSISDNMFLACKGVDFGATGSYFAVLDAASTKKLADNVWLGCQGSQHLENNNDFDGDVWIDYGNWRTYLYYASVMLEQRLIPEKSNLNMLLSIYPSKDPASRTGITISNRSLDSREILRIEALGTKFILRQHTRTDLGYTLRPVVFEVDDFAGGASNLVEVARIDTDKNFKFNTLVLPTSAPSNPVAGSTYFDPATNTLYIYNGTSWVSTTLA